MDGQERVRRSVRQSPPKVIVRGLFDGDIDDVAAAPLLDCHAAVRVDDGEVVDIEEYVEWHPTLDGDDGLVDQDFTHGPPLEYIE